MRSLRLSPDPLGSEAYASQLVASFVDPDDGLDRDTLERFLAALHGRSTAESLALLRALSSVVPDFEMRAISGAYADSLAAEGTDEPRWKGQFERTRLVDACEFADVYGDQRTIMCTYSGPTEKHALVGFVNTSHLGGHLEDIVLTTAIDRAVSGFSSRAAQSDGLVTFGPVSAEVAHEVLAAALANSYRTEGVADEVVALRALLGARLASTAPELPKRSSAQQNSNELVQSFLASAALGRHGVDPHRSDTLAAVEALVQFGTEFDAGRITRLSPVKLRAFADWIADEEVIELRSCAATLRAWVDWILTECASRELPQLARTRIRETLEEFLPPERPASIALNIGLDDLFD